MENLQRAIILDLDETLEKGQFGFANQAMMMLRPNIDVLISKLKQAKQNNIDVILCTTASSQWVERFLNLKPEFRDIFDKTYTKDNETEWQELGIKAYPHEYQIYKGQGQKPVTTFGYNSILFIDDNSLEQTRLKELLQAADDTMDKDVTYFSGFGYWPPDAELIYFATEVANGNEELEPNKEMATVLEEYLKCLREEPGCLFMCDAIDYFMGKSFEPGLTILDDKYKERYTKFKNILSSTDDKFEDLYWDCSDIENSIEVRNRLKQYWETDKKYPYEGLEIQPISELQRKEKELQKLQEEARNLAELEQMIGKDNSNDEKP